MHVPLQKLTEEEGMSGNRKESIVTEYQSFTHLTYSKNKVHDGRSPQRSAAARDASLRSAATALPP